MKYSFAPLIDEGAEIIIIGSLPSEKSLQKKQYYGNPQNYFWRLVYALFGRTPDESYQKRCDFLLKHHIALWDAVYCAENKNSMDVNIKNETPNDFDTLFRQYPNIRHIFFNGAKAEQVFRKYHKNIRMPYTRLCSSSPIPTRNARNFEERLKAWQCVKEELERK